MDKPLRISVELLHAVDNIEGWLTHQEADLLYRLCDGTWCEIGSWKGKSTLVLASKHKGYAIDWFKGSTETKGADTYEDFVANMQAHNVLKNITVISDKFQRALKQVPSGIQLLFLDAEHTYRDTKRAFEMYEPLVKQGGYIVLHDVWPWPEDKNPYPGVTRFAEELLTDKRFKHVENVHRCMAVQKL